ncbi:MAG: phage tail tape measure protein [Planctomycetia bacterium]|nr:phage tail tape measure protein [Planctomycetia bacterium]
MGLTNQVDILYKANIKQALSNTAKIENKTEKTSSNINKSLKKIKAGWLAIAVGTTAVIAGFIKVIKVASNFEQSIANVASVSGGSRKELEKLARVAGKKTVFSATQASKALYLLASSGLDVKDMAKVLTPTLNLAAAAQIEIAEATDLLVGQLKIFQADMQDAEMFTDIMAKTVASANTDMRQLGSALSYVSPIATQLGMSFEDVNVLLAGMADKGIKAERAGTQLRGALSRLIDPTAKMKEVLDKNNISLVDLKNSLNDPIKLFELLKPVTDDAQDSLAIFGRRNLTVATLVKDSVPHLKDLRSEIENAGGAAKKMADIQLATLNSQMKLLKSAIEEQAIAFGNKFLPELTNIVKEVTKWLNGSRDLDVITQDLISTNTEYKDVIFKLTEQAGKLNKEEKDILETRKATLRIKLLDVINELNDKYKESHDIGAKLGNQQLTNQQLRQGEIKLLETTKTGIIDYINKLEKLDQEGTKEIKTLFEIINVEKELIKQSKRLLEIDTQLTNQKSTLGLELVNEKKAIDELASSIIISKDNSILLLIEDKKLRKEIEKRIEELKTLSEVETEAGDKRTEEREKDIAEETEKIEVIKELRKLDAEERALLQEEINELMKTTDEEMLEHRLSLIATELESETVKKDEKIRLAQEAADIIDQLETSRLNKWLKKNEDHIKQLGVIKKKGFDIAKQFIDNETSALENQKAKGEITEKEYQKKKAELQIKAFKINKAMAVSEAAINVAVAITKAFTAGPLIGQILAGITAGLGAVQLALIAKQEPPAIPAFAEGTLSAPGGIALVGDEGPELVNLPRGSRVYNNTETNEIMNNTTPINIENVTLPNVSNAEEFFEAIQQYQREYGVIA